MEVNAKLKELDEEFKVLKAEIRNVLLDIREVILDRTNPLGEEHESAHLTLDLNTTARAMATEAAAHEAMKAVEGVEHLNDGLERATEDEAAVPELPPELTDETHHDASGLATEAAPAEATEDEPAADDDEPMPKVIRRNRTAADHQPAEQLPTEIPRMYQANVPPLSGNVSISSWLTEALEAVGPQELERIINIHRLWGNLPSNISRALAYVQELLQTTEDTEPAWLKVMQELDRLAAL
ncbi:MAG TPA: hypothetical protein VLS25_13325 [Dehalococcoidia bacterium]|nr:hypothetical protein [Dehalococcoidia bacterium]